MDFAFSCSILLHTSVIDWCSCIEFAQRCMQSCMSMQVECMALQSQPFWKFAAQTIRFMSWPFARRSRRATRSKRQAAIVTARFQAFLGAISLHASDLRMIARLYGCLAQNLLGRSMTQMLASLHPCFTYFPSLAKHKEAMCSCRCGTDWHDHAHCEGLLQVPR